MASFNLKDYTTIYKKNIGYYSSTLCIPSAAPVTGTISPGDPCEISAGIIVRDNDGSGNCYECIDYQFSEIRIVQFNTNPTYSYLKILLNFDERGGTSVSNKFIYYSRTYGTLPTPTRSGYTFNG
jgi:hypothetical protein